MVAISASSEVKAFDSSSKQVAITLLGFLLAVAIILLVVAPLAHVFDIATREENNMGVSEVRSLTALIDVYTSAEYLEPLAHTFVLAVVVTALSLLAGVGMAVIVARTNIPFKSMWDLMIMMPLFLSPFTLLIAWVTLAGPNTGFLNGIGNAIFRAGISRPPNIVNINTYLGIVWVMFLVSCPMAYLFTIGTLRGMDSSLEEASRSAGASPLRTILSITLPVCLPSILSAGLLIFILTMETYTIPGVLGSAFGYSTLPWQLYIDSSSVPPRLAHAAAAGTLLLVITGAGIWAQRRITRFSSRYVTITGKSASARPFDLGRAQWIFTLVLALYVGCAVVLPLIALIVASFLKFSAAVPTIEAFTTIHYTQFFTEPASRAALPNTILLAVVSAATCVVLGVTVGALDLRRPRWWTKVIASVGILPVAVPGLIFGFGILWTYISTPLYGTIGILLLAHIARFIPYGLIASRAALLQVHPSLEECGRMAGAGPTRVLATITLPLVKPALIATLFLVMVQSVKELSASILLFTPRSQVLSTLTWQYVESGDFQYAATIGIIQTIMLVAMILITRYLLGLRLERGIGKGVS